MTKAETNEVAAEALRDVHEFRVVARAALVDALEGMEEMLPYVPDYFREKHDLDAYIERARRALACPLTSPVD